jgi:hypothetical protein
VSFIGTLSWQEFMQKDYSDSTRKSDSKLVVNQLLLGSSTVEQRQTFAPTRNLDRNTYVYNNKDGSPILVTVDKADIMKASGEWVDSPANVGKGKKLMPKKKATKKE